MHSKVVGPPGIVLGLSGNGLGVVRSLGRGGVYVIGVTDDLKAPNAYSRYISEKWYFDGSERKMVEMLIQRAKAFDQRPVLLPIRDATVLAIADRLEEIRKVYNIGMPDSDIIKKALCKKTFSKMAENLGLPTPRTFLVRSINQIDTVIKQISFPCILKPEFRSEAFIAHASAKAFFAQTQQELKEQYLSFSEAEPEVVVQEYIPGDDNKLYFCFQYYDRESNPLLTISGRKIRQWPPRSGSTTSCEVVNVPEIETLSTQFFQGIGYTGPCSMEFKRDPRNGEYVFIEPTVGRTDWNNSFAEGNGIPIPLIAYHDLTGLNAPRFEKKSLSRRWIRWSSDSRAASYYKKAGNLSLWGWIWSIRPPIIWAIWSWDDPAPLLIMYLRRLRRKFTKLIKLLRVTTL